MLTVNLAKYVYQAVRHLTFELFCAFIVRHSNLLLGLWGIGGNRKLERLLSAYSAFL